MTDAAIQIEGLAKVYRSATGRIAAVDGLDLIVPRGGIHGFLGPNGAGKTTTLRLLLGLTRPTRGSMQMLGKSVPDQLTEVIDRVGALVEEPLFSRSLSGRRNLQLLARTIGRSKQVVDDALEEVRLGRESRHTYRRLTVAQKQRLGIAAALIKDAELVLLDEPTDSLDPAGMEDFRDILRRLEDRGTTVLLASHDLAEVQQLCSTLSIIGDGKLLAQGSVEDLVGERTVRTRVEVDQPDRAAATLTAAGYDVRRDGDALVVQGHEHPEQITRVLAEKQLYVSELSAIRPDLHAYYLELTGHEPREDPREEEIA
jgi:ABC-2 type transport system ATP-binding protein